MVVTTCGRTSVEILETVKANTEWIGHQEDMMRITGAALDADLKIVQNHPRESSAAKAAQAAVEAIKSGASWQDIC